MTRPSGQQAMQAWWPVAPLARAAFLTAAVLVLALGLPATLQARGRTPGPGS